VLAESVNCQALAKNRKSLVDKKSEVDLSIARKPYIIHTSTPLANEVIMVFKGWIIASTTITKMNRTNLSLFSQSLQIAIDGAKAHAW